MAKKIARHTAKDEAIKEQHQIECYLKYVQKQDAIRKYECILCDIL